MNDCTFDKIEKRGEKELKDIYHLEIIYEQSSKGPGNNNNNNSNIYPLS